MRAKIAWQKERMVCTRVSKRPLIVIGKASNHEQLEHVSDWRVIPAFHLPSIAMLDSRATHKKNALHLRSDSGARLAPAYLFFVFWLLVINWLYLLLN